MRVEGITNEAPKPVAAYSQSIRMGGLIAVAGQAGVDPKTNAVVEGGLTLEMEQTRKNIEAILHSCDASMDDVIRVDVFLADINDFAEMSAAYASWFMAPYPTRTTVGTALAAGLLVEVTVLAVAPTSAG
jgi:2-iminobutanoate/2-iminopropanoate deaminase